MTRRNPASQDRRHLGKHSREEIERQQPDTAAFVDDMRVLARQFQFEAMGRQLANQEGSHEQRA